MPAWVFERENRELRFLVKYFQQSDEGVLRISWRDGIGKGAPVQAGMALADLTWNDGRQETLTAPEGCDGKIAAVNGRIRYEILEAYPSEWALRVG